MEYLPTFGSGASGLGSMVIVTIAITVAALEVMLDEFGKFTALKHSFLQQNWGSEPFQASVVPLSAMP